MNNSPESGKKGKKVEMEINRKYKVYTIKDIFVSVTMWII